MKTIKLQGKEIPVTPEIKEAILALAKEFTEEEPAFDLQIGDSVYFPSYDEEGAEDSKVGTNRNLEAWESKSEKNILWIEAILKLKNWADKNNEEFGTDLFFLYKDTGPKIQIADIRFPHYYGILYFSSEEIAQKAIDHFGEDFIKLYLGMPE